MLLGFLVAALLYALYQTGVYFEKKIVLTYNKTLV